MKEKLIKFTLPWPEATPPSEKSQPLIDAPTKTRILIAEDDPVSRVLLVSWLQKWGYDVVVTSDGADAMEVLRRPNAPSLAILDWWMPHMDGFEICRRLRESKKMVYIILLTAHRGIDNMIEGLRVGADDYLTKPFIPEELHARLLAGVRVMTSQERLAFKVRSLELVSADTFRLQLPL